MGFQLLLGVEGSQVSLCYLLGFIRCMSSLWEKFKNSLLAGLFFFFKENCFPLIKLEFIPLKLTCHRPQQAGKGSPAGPGNSSNAPINCSWTRKNGTSHNPLTDSMCALRCLCFYFYGCSSWSREIPVTFQLSFSEKRGKRFLPLIGDEIEKGDP